ncbi:MAG TPA: FAD-binding protein [Tepidisphaeraceae bacterium]|jgi:succinate dehydrogenase / fumarate reductase flavoprotein subunit/fumarate reductase flavoprotein subunit|nr:FAD-binding protein [Tepidisphaeraceae bacterium]
MLPLDEIQTDILILGAGGAGMLAALHARTLSPTLRITLVVKGLLGQSGCTRMVQGGYNCVLNPGDSIDKHFTDTIKGGQFINNQDLAYTLVNDSPDRIIELENVVGCLFDRNPDGTIHQKPFAGQSFDRTVHKGDLTGIEIMSNLRDWVLDQGNIQVLEETRGLDLLMGNGSCTGAVLLDNRKGRFVAVRAKATLLATGAGATMYEISSPSLEKAGDGQAMAYRVGAEFIDMEMMQFHPTGLLVGRSIATGGLLEEGLRGAGAHLFNAKGERFMEKYSDKLERATRDVVSRSSYLEIMAGRGTPSGGVLIDATHMKDVAKNFKGMVERCAEYGFDLVGSRVEVSPSAHYHMGGVKIDNQCKSNIDGLFAAGEDAGGVHGANRLGGNGVADSIVFGARAGDSMAEYVSTKPDPAYSRAAAEEICKRWMAPMDRKTGESPFELRAEMERIMWRKVGVVRNGPAMREAVGELADVRQRIEKASGSGSTIFNSKWNEVINTANLVVIAEMLTQSALLREESRGAHYRLDFPEQNGDWLKNILCLPVGDDLKFSYQDVKFTRLQPPPEILQPPKAKPTVGA